jgi:type IV pilus assembly protein PilB
MAREKLGEILLKMGAIDSLQLQSALGYQRRWGTPLGKTLVENRFLTGDTLMRALSQQTGLPVVNLDQEYLSDKLAVLLPRKAALQTRVVPLRTEGKRDEVLVVAMAAPATLSSLDEVQKASGKHRVRALLADDGALDRAFARIYENAPALRPPLHGHVLPVLEDEQVFEDAGDRPVLIYGWPEEAGQKLGLILAVDGVPARLATAEDVRAALPTDVLVAPLAAAEALFPATRCECLLLVLGHAPDTEVERARRIGARGFLAAPIDTGLLLRAVRRCRQHAPATA